MMLSKNVWEESQAVTSLSQTKDKKKLSRGCGQMMSSLFFINFVKEKNTKKCSQSLVQFNFGKTTLLLEKL